ncbi:MAG: T9SS type A sorting domain-containing protein [Flavobacteriales bacterium]|nr:T9SS type A sorting domain-containing protein [Flavobacteriales bacterium]
MLRGLFLLSIYVFTGYGSVSAQVLFQRVYGGSGYDSGCEVIPTSDNGYLVAGTSGSFEEGMSSQILLIKTDLNGYVEWRKTYGGQYADVAKSMQETADGDLIIAGFQETTLNSYQFSALKLTSDGDTIWSRSYGGSQWDICNKVLALSDGGFALFGQTYSYGAGDGDFYLVRTDTDGDTLWTKTYGGAGLESGESISLTDEGGFYLTGYSESYGAGKKDAYIIKTDAVGDTIWTRTFGKGEDEYAYGSCTTNDGGVVIVGGSFSNSPDEGDFMVHKRSASGDSLRTRIEDGSTDEYWLDVMEDFSGKLLLAGYVEDSEVGKEDVRIMRIDQNLNFDGMAASRGSAENDRAFDIKETYDNAYVIVGLTNGFLNRYDDVYLFTADHQGEVGSPELGVDEIVIDGQQFDVIVAPNPISDGFSTLYITNFIGLRKLMKSELIVRFCNVHGQIVFEKRVESDVEKLNMHIPNGIYFYQLVSGNTILATGKAVKVN